jgi:sugar phosphate isomerase/epimerase
MTRALGLLAVLAPIGAAGAAPASADAPKREWAVTIRDPYLAGLGADDVWAAARSVGIRRLEVVLDRALACPHLYEKDSKPYRIDTPQNRQALRRKLEAEGMSIGCFAMVVKLARPEDSAQALDWVTKAAEAAPEVGCRMLMLPIAITDARGERVEDAEFVSRGKAFVRELDGIAGRTGIQITIENLGHYWNRPEILEPVLRVSRPDRVGLLNDICNMYWYGHPLDKLYDLARQFAPYVRCVHVKSVKYPADKRNEQRSPGWEYGKHTEPVRTGDIDFARILAIYAKAGYIGDVCIEDDSLPRFDAAGKKKVIADDVALLKELIAALPKAP